MRATDPLVSLRSPSYRRAASSVPRAVPIVLGAAALFAVLLSYPQRHAQPAELWGEDKAAHIAIDWKGLDSLKNRVNGDLAANKELASKYKASFATKAGVTTSALGSSEGAKWLEEHSGRPWLDTTDAKCCGAGGEGEKEQAQAAGDVSIGAVIDGLRRKLRVMSEHFMMVRANYLHGPARQIKVMVNPRGRRGFTGPEGTPGQSGPQGPKGPLGPVGQKGPTGPAGPQGPDGRAGQQGMDGAMGPAGNEGEQGAQGPVGAAGAAGPMGARGLPGAAGSPGANGKDGIPGPAGRDGGAGMPGPAGQPGPPGPAGADGKQGPKGVQGPAGKDGLDGEQGPQGPKGYEYKQR